MKNIGYGKWFRWMPKVHSHKDQSKKKWLGSFYFTFICIFLSNLNRLVVLLGWGNQHFFQLQFECMALLLRFHLFLLYFLMSCLNIELLVKSLPSHQRTVQSNINDLLFLLNPIVWYSNVIETLFSTIRKFIKWWRRLSLLRIISF
jgi:hypothetical protein